MGSWESGVGSGSRVRGVGASGTGVGASVTEDEPREGVGDAATGGSLLFTQIDHHYGSSGGQ